MAVEAERTARKHAKAAAEAHTDLNTFHAIIQILEGGCIYGVAAQADANRIIARCKAAAQKQLKIMDRHVEAIGGR